MQKLRGHRVVRAAAALFAFVTSIIGLAGIADDVETWSRWIGGLDWWWPYVIAYLLFMAFGTWMIWPEFRRLADMIEPPRIKRPTPEQADATTVPPKTREPQDRTPDRVAKLGANAQRWDADRVTKLGTNPLIAASREQDAKRSADRDLRARLQRALDEGTQLEVRAPASVADRLAGLAFSTSEGEVSAWLARVERMLKDEPVLLSRFRAMPRVPITALVGVRVSLEPKHTGVIRQRVANLDSIIRDLPQ